MENSAYDLNASILKNTLDISKQNPHSHIRYYALNIC